MASRYEIRRKALQALGFASYDEYLASDLWATIKARILARDGGCKTCQNPAYTAHHITYAEAVMRGEDDSQLVAICRCCHKYAEFERDKKLTYTTEISKKLAKRALKKLGGAASKKTREAMRPRCRCCDQQFKRLGRNDICLNCYRSGKALEIVNKASA